MRKIALARMRDFGADVSVCTEEELGAKRGDFIIVEIERGIDYAQLTSDFEAPDSKSSKSNMHKIIRAANKEDLERIEKNKAQIPNVLKTCQRKIEEHNLDMKLINAEFSFDKNKAIFYFISEERVDFRELVKDLAKIFKTRIEMRGQQPHEKLRDQHHRQGQFKPLTVPQQGNDGQ